MVTWAASSQDMEIKKHNAAQNTLNPIKVEDSTNALNLIFISTFLDTKQKFKKPFIQLTLEKNQEFLVFSNLLG